MWAALALTTGLLRPLLQGFYVFIRAIQLLTAKNPGTIVVG